MFLDILKLNLIIIRKKRSFIKINQMTAGKNRNLSVVFFMGLIMKKCICIILVFFIASLSILAYCPVGIHAADNDFTTSTPTGCKLSNDEARKAINNRGDIYTSEHKLVLEYTPHELYNWTTASGIAHLSDNQALALLMADNKFEEVDVLLCGIGTNNAFLRSLLTAAGVITTGNSEFFTEMVDLMGNNSNFSAVIKSLDYNEETETITLDKDASGIESFLRLIRHNYHTSIGALVYEVGDYNPSKAIEERHINYEYEEDYLHDFNDVTTYDFSLSMNMQYIGGIYDVLAWNASDYKYMYYSDLEENIIFMDNDLNRIDEPFKRYCNELNRYYDDGYRDYISNLIYIPDSYVDNSWFHMYIGFERINSNGEFMEHDSNNGNYYTRTTKTYYHRIYSKKYSYLTVFKSYEALYNYVHGSQTAYLTSQMGNLTEDITLSIKDMDKNLGSKLDTLIDSLNNNKGGMSAEELQSAIDKGVEDILNNTEEIKDNTEDIVNNTGNILDTLKKQNAILLDILGVTSYIAYQNNEDKENSFTMSDMSDMLHKSFTSVIAAVMYGKMADDVTDTNASYKEGIFGRFPFSVPYQLYEWLKVLQVEPKCPEFTYNYGFLIGVDENEEEYENYNITFDLSDYESWRNNLSSFLKLSFTLAFAIGIYKKFKGDV